MASCEFPINTINSFYKTGKRNGCTTKGKYKIIFQGREIFVCKIHKQFNGRDNAY